VKKIYFLLIIVALSLASGAISNNFRLFLIKPDLLLVAVVLSSLSFEPLLAVTFSIFAGILKDVFETSSLNSLLFAFWSIVIIKVSKKISLDSELLRALLVLVIVILNCFLKAALIFSEGNTVPTGIFLKIIILESTYTAFVSFWIFKLTDPLLARKF